MKKSFKKALSLFLSILMVLSIIIPMGAFSVLASDETQSTAISVTDDDIMAWYASAVDGVLNIDDEKELLCFANGLAGFQNDQNTTDTSDDETVRYSYDGMIINLTADIDLNPGYTGGINKPENVWPDTCTNAVNFYGVFEGNDHTVSGIYFEPTSGNAGLLGNVLTLASNTVKVQNLAIVNSFIYLSAAKDFCGTLFGNVAGGNTVEIKNVYIDVTMRHGNTYPADAGRCGGFVSFLAGSAKLTFESCVFAGDIWLTRTTNTTSGTANVQPWNGGFVGYTNNADTQLSFNNCAFYGKLTSSHTSSAFVGAVITKPTTPYSYTNCVVGGYLRNGTGSNFAFAAGRKSYATLENCYCTNEYVVGVSTIAEGSETPVSKTNEEISALTIDGWKLDEVGNAPLPASIADSFTTDVTIVHKSWYSADDADKVFTISTPAQLLGFAELIADGTTFNGMTVELGDDIAVNTLMVNENTKLIASSWYPMSYNAGNNSPADTVKREFEGILNGQNHSISGIYYLADITLEYGLFGSVRDASATVKNISILDSVIVANRSIGGGLFGNVTGSNLTISNVYTDIDIIYSQYAAISGSDCKYGGLIGNISAAGEVTILIENTVVAGTIDVPLAMVGGFVGYTDRCVSLTINDSAFYGAIKGNGNSTSGVVGRMASSAGYNTTLNNVIIAGNASTNGAVSNTVYAFARVKSGTLVANNCLYTNAYTYTATGSNTAESVSAADITGSAAIAALKADSFDVANTWVATVKGMPMPASVAEMVGALEVLDLEAGYKTAFVGYQTTDVTDGKFSVRLIAVVDSIDHMDAGFKVTATCTSSGRNNTTDENGYSVTKVYNSIKAADVDYTAADFSNQGGYVITLVLNGFEVSEGEVTFTVETFADSTVTESVPITFTLDTTKVS